MTLPNSSIPYYYTYVAYLAQGAADIPTAEADWKALDLDNIENIRSISPISVVPNIVRQPQLGRDTTIAGAAQPDTPDLIVTLNYTPSLHEKFRALSRRNATHFFRVRFFEDKPAATLVDADGDDVLFTSEIVYGEAYNYGVFAGFEPSIVGDDISVATLTIAMQDSWTDLYTTV